MPGTFQFLAGRDYGSDNVVVAVLVWAMVYPMMVTVDLPSLTRVHDRPEWLIITLADRRLPIALATAD